MKFILPFSFPDMIPGLYRYHHRKRILRITSMCLLLAVSTRSWGQAGREQINLKSNLASGNTFGPSFPVGAFQKISNAGLHSNTGVEWYVSPNFWLRGLLEFSTYRFKSISQQNSFVLQQNGNRTLIMVLADVGYRTQLGKWTPAVYVGNGLAYYTEPVLSADFFNRRVSVVHRSKFYYALHAGVQLEYLLKIGFKPFFELSTTFFPKTLVISNTTFMVLQPKIGIKFPLNSVLNSVFKHQNP